jgi:hypothetical protein
MQGAAHAARSEANRVKITDADGITAIVEGNGRVQE